MKGGRSEIGMGGGLKNVPYVCEGGEKKNEG